MRYFTILLICLIFSLLSCSSDPEGLTPTDEALVEAVERASATGDLNYYVFPDSDDYAALPNQDPANPVSKEKIELGRLLFFETGLAQLPNDDNCYETYSCSSCHIPTAGFLPGRIQGIADGAFGFGHNGENRFMRDSYEEEDLDAQGTRPMNPMNSGYSTNTLWSGLFGAGGVNEGTEAYWTGLAEVNHTGFGGLEAQNIEGFNLHRLDINDHVLDDYGYRDLYDKAFPDFPENERYSPTTSSFAISAFLRSFMANRAPFQEWLKGDKEAISEEQKEGALLFFGKAKCYTCHRESALNGMTFHALGTPDMYTVGGLNTGPDDERNLGRGMFTGRDEDNYKFKVPQLYNTKDYVSFFHGSSKSSIEEVVDFKLKAQSENPQVAASRLSSFFNPVSLTEEERANLIDFLRNALYDAQTERYVPEAVLSGNCFPNNDVQAQVDLGCK